MKSEISPAVAGVIVVLAVLVVGFFVWHGTTGHRAGISPEDKAKLQAMIGGSAAGAPMRGPSATPDLGSGH